MLKMGFHYHVPGKNEGDQLQIPGYFGRFLDSIAYQCDHLTCFFHTPLPGEEYLMDYTLAAQNVEFVDIGPHTSVPRRLLNSRTITKIVQDKSKELDVFLLRGPSPLLPVIARAAAASSIPTVFLLVADYLAGIDALAQSRWRKIAIRLWAHWNYAQQLRLSRHSLTFVNSHALYQKLNSKISTIYETRTTTLDEKDFYERENTCIQKPYRLLYTGRLAAEKGILDIIDATSILISSGEEVILDIVGWAEKNDLFLKQLQAEIRRKNISDHVFFHGYKPVGPALFAYYRQADVYVLASKSDFEGFPRTIWEALAHCVPVVATGVGSIPHFLKDGVHAKLVEPKNSRSLADTLRLVIHDSTLRQRLIKNGFAIAHENTLQKRSEELMSQIETWLDDLNCA